MCSFEHILEAAPQRSPISQTIQERQTRHDTPCRWSKDELINDVLLQIPEHGHTIARWAVKTYIHQFCAYTQCRLEDLLCTIDMDGEWEREFKESVLSERLDNDYYYHFFLFGLAFKLVVSCLYSIIRPYIHPVQCRSLFLVISYMPPLRFEKKITRPGVACEKKIW